MIGRTCVLFVSVDDQIRKSLHLRHIATFTTHHTPFQNVLTSVAGSLPSELFFSTARTITAATSNPITAAAVPPMTISLDLLLAFDGLPSLMSEMTLGMHMVNDKLFPEKRYVGDG